MNYIYILDVKIETVSNTLNDAARLVYDSFDAAKLALNNFIREAGEEILFTETDRTKLDRKQLQFTKAKRSGSSIFHYYITEESLMDMADAKRWSDRLDDKGI